MCVALCLSLLVMVRMLLGMGSEARSVSSKSSVAWPCLSCGLKPVAREPGFGPRNSGYLIFSACLRSAISATRLSFASTPA